MIFKKIKLLLLICLLGLSSGLLSQKLHLNLTSKAPLENLFLTTLPFQQKHSDTISIQRELKRIERQLKLHGFFLSSLDSTLIKKTTVTAFFSLKEKLDTVALHFKQKPTFLLPTFKFKDSILSLPMHALEETLEKISDSYENAGNAFSKINLKNFRVKDKKLFAEIQFTTAKKRKINKLIFKGYPDFPRSFIRNHFEIREHSVFNKKRLQEFSKLSQSLSFATEIKPPETLFTQDSTFVYIYLKKKKGSSFDGLINFTSQESGKIQFNGHLDLKLNNLLNKGERLALLWNHYGNEKQELQLSTATPYIFNSKISPELKFSLYKQDSTFLNTTLHTNIPYQIKNNASLYVSFTATKSEKLENTSLENITSFKSNFLGFGYQLRVPKNNFLKKTSFSLDINPSFGKRKDTNGNSHQIKLESTLSYLLDVNQRSSLYFRNSIGVLNSDSYVENELFRIGGNSSIRGFKEQSLYVKEFVVQNIEYRYHTATDAFLYSITDVAFISTTERQEKLIGLGIGYLFSTNNAQINISAAVGSSTKTPQNFKNTQLFVNWVNFF